MKFSLVRYFCFCHKTRITMGKNTNFLGQPVQASSEMEAEAANHILHDHNPVFQPDFQGCGEES